jgi:hypothetical protein
MSRPALNPGFGWPLEMRSETAAAYLDEPSVEAFLAKVSKGFYSQPSRTKGALPKWHRAKLTASLGLSRSQIQKYLDTVDVEYRDITSPKDAPVKLF